MKKDFLKTLRKPLCVLASAALALSMFGACGCASNDFGPKKDRPH